MARRSVPTRERYVPQKENRFISGTPIDEDCILKDRVIEARKRTVQRATDSPARSPPVSDRWVATLRLGVGSTLIDAYASIT